jgi:uncharacterized protein (DUF58 family)
MNDTAGAESIGTKSKAFSLQPTGIFLSWFGLLVLLAGMLLAAWYGQVFIVILLGLILSAAALSRLWSRYSLAGVSCRHLLSEDRVFPGEYIDLKLRLDNRKLLPLPWVQVDDELPLRFSPDISPGENSRPGYGLLSKSAALLWYTGVSWHERLYCQKRGYYPLGPLRVTSGDIFGFYPRSTTLTVADRVIVYPRIYPVTSMVMPSLYPLGETTAERRIFEDPLRVVGVRAYTPRDSRRHIHWKATARHGELQVKVFEPTTTLKVAIFLAVDSFKSGQGEIFNEENFELGVSAAASIAGYLIERRNAVGLLVNSRLADSGQPAVLLPGSSRGQLVEVLETLAKVTPDPSGPFDGFLQAERTALPWGTTFLFIIREPSPSLTPLLAGLKESGHKMAVLQVGGKEASDTPGMVPWQHVRQAGDLANISFGDINEAGLA